MHHEDEGMMGAFLVLDTTATGINSIAYDNKNINIYPNPTNSLISIKSTTLAKIENVLISDLLGKTVLEMKINNTEFINSIDISKLSSGQYFIKIKTSDGFVNKKIIKN